MLNRFILILLIIDSVVLVAAILLQSGKGGGLAASFGGASSSADALLGTRQAGNLLTRTSWWAGGIFIFLSFVLQISSSRGRAPTSVLDKAVAVPPAAPTAPAMQGGAAQSVVPLQTAPTTPAPAAPAPAKQP